MAPKSKKTSYVLFSDNSNLTRWNRVVRLNESPPLTYRPQDHLSEGARTRSVSFSKFSHFLIFLWSFVLICFWTCICLGFVVVNASRLLNHPSQWCSQAYSVLVREYDGMEVCCTLNMWLESESILRKLPRVSDVATNHWVKNLDSWVWMSGYMWGSCYAPHNACPYTVICFGKIII